MKPKAGMQTSYYKQYVPGFHLSLERGSDSVSADGRYHILQNGQIVASFRMLKKAQEKLRELAKQAGYMPEETKNEPKNAAQEGIERYLDAKDRYWAESYKFKGKGGKGGRGGV